MTFHPRRQRIAADPKRNQPQVRELEQIVGTELFRRVGRRVVVTRVGKKLADNLAIDLENIRQAIMRGAALLPTYQIERELSEGRLVALDPATITTEYRYYLVTPAGTQNEHVALFVDWMKSRLV